MLLEDICDIYSGYAIKEFNEDKLGIPVIKISNILKDGTVTCIFSRKLAGTLFCPALPVIFSSAFFLKIPKLVSE